MFQVTDLSQTCKHAFVYSFLEKYNKRNRISIANRWHNSKCRLCGDRDVTVNHIINKCSKMAQKEY